MLYPQNGDRIVTIDSVTSLHPMYTRSSSKRDNRRDVATGAAPGESRCVYALFASRLLADYEQTCMFVRRVSILLWRRCDTLCTSGFVDDVMCTQNGPA